MENTVGQTFLEQTKYHNLETSPQKLGEPLPALELEVAKTIERINLPDFKIIPLSEQNIIALIEKRETLRNYKADGLLLEELTYLLWGTQGVKTITDYPVTRRTVPSAGSRHPFETYLLVNRVERLEPGLYRYLALEHKLAQLPTAEDIKEKLTRACLQQDHVRNSAVTFFWVAIPIRTIWRYCQRGYRYMFLDAGHVCQNLYLMAESINCGVCAIAAYDDDLVNQALGLDGKTLFTIYIATLGKRG